MLKIIGILSIFTISLNLQAFEYQVQIKDTVTGENLVQNCANETELNTLTTFLTSHTDSAVQFTVKKAGSVSIESVKRGGGEGGTD